METAMAKPSTKKQTINSASAKIWNSAQDDGYVGPEAENHDPTVAPWMLRWDTEKSGSFRAGKKEGADLIRDALGPDAERGRKVMEGSRKGKERRASDASEMRQRKVEEYQEWQKKIDQLYNGHPNWSYENMVKELAKQLQQEQDLSVSRKTIKRHTSNPRRRPHS